MCTLSRARNSHSQENSEETSCPNVLWNPGSDKHIKQKNKKI